MTRAAAARAPLPPADLDRRRIPLDDVPRGARVWRIHRPAHDALFFGPGDPKSPQGRFDAPDGAYTVCYLGESPEAAFAETMLRDVPVRFLSRALLGQRSLASLTATRRLRVVDLNGSGLAKLGTTALLTSGEHEPARAWARALWAHPTRPDGLRYRSRHDPSQLGLALFDRARGALAVESTVGLLGDAARLAALLGRYEVGLVG